MPRLDEACALPLPYAVAWCRGIILCDSVDSACVENIHQGQAAYRRFEMIPLPTNRARLITSRGHWKVAGCTWKGMMVETMDRSLVDQSCVSSGMTSSASSVQFE